MTGNVTRLFHSPRSKSTMQTEEEPKSKSRCRAWDALRHSQGINQRHTAHKFDPCHRKGSIEARLISLPNGLPEAH